MKLLTVIRHAKSSWKDPGQDDFDRPLNRRGERDAPEMGQRLAAVRPAPDLVLASPAARAARTAQVIAEAAKLEDALVFERTLYLATPGQMLGLLQDRDDALTHIALVGHNPGVTDLVNGLGDVHIANMPTCGIARLELEVERWRDAAPGCARLLDFDYPKKTA